MPLLFTKQEVSEFEDTGVGWKHPKSSNPVFTEYVDESGTVRRYTDPSARTKRLMDESHIFDLDAMDLMMGVLEPGPFFSPTFASKLISLADSLDQKGFFEEADTVDEILKKRKKKDPYTKELKDQTYVELEYFPEDNIYSPSGAPLSNL